MAKPPSADEARARADKIRKGLQETWKDIQEAYEKRDDKVLGYPSWDTYCKAEFGTCYDTKRQHAGCAGV